MMSTEGSASYVMALVSAVGSSAVQAASPASPQVHPVVVPIVSAVVGGLMSFAVLKTTVRVVERDLLELKEDVKELTKSVAKMQGHLGVDE